VVVLRIKEIAIDQRPRERLKSKGIDSLNDSEVLALLLEKGTNGENVIDLSHRLISTFGLEEINSLSLTELMKIKGIGLAKAAKLIAAFELSKRVCMHEYNYNFFIRDLIYFCNPLSQQ